MHESWRFGAGLSLLFVAATAVADAGDLLSVSATVTTAHFDNLFKRPSDGSLGNVSSDNVTTTQIGISARKLISLQSFELGATVSDNRYEQFSALNSRNNGHNAAWHWQVTPHLTGGISSTRQQSQTDFADFRGTGQNLRTTDTRRVNADWTFLGGWTLGAGATSTTQSNSQTFAQDAGSKQRIADMLLKYAFPSGTSLALTSSISQGDYQRAADPLTLSDSRFSERKEDIRLDWPITGKTKLAATIGRVSRKNENFSARDYSDSNDNLSLSWAATSKTTLLFSFVRAAENWQDAASSFAIRKALNISGTWNPSAKLSVRASVERETKTYDGFALVPATFDQVDKTGKESLTMTWAARPNFNLAATVQTAKRSSNRPGFDYADQQATVSASLMF